MNLEAPALDRDREIALAECARAAADWHNPARASREKLAAVSHAMAWAARANGGVLPARTLSEFLQLWIKPVEEWLNASGGPLLEEGALTEFAMDLIAE